MHRRSGSVRGCSAAPREGNAAPSPVVERDTASSGWIADRFKLARKP